MKVVLVEPEIPFNTGSIGRTCVALDLELILVGKLGFSLDSSSVARSGTRYWKSVQLDLYNDWAEFVRRRKPRDEQLYFFEEDGSRRKNYYVPESVGIAIGFLIAAIHDAGLVCLEHTPNPMKFLNSLCGRPDNEKPVMILPIGYPSQDATIPKAAKLKKPLNEIMTVF